MARAPQPRRGPAAPGNALRALLLCNLPPGAQRVVVSAVLALLVLINVVLIFLLAFR
ncbi:small integral membrane protein 39 [Hylobates moloch]|uniref:small integral membrane protein 39 n=1 Tax=Hylobates moloch TaxID=81572 RepID=UPI0024434600|nr:small integral membrane protein 39 [Symphalangus syndactylus]XP_058290258.1 small integral membrane protein 39 [Hylobates moloch]